MMILVLMSKSVQVSVSPIFPKGALGPYRGVPWGLGPIGAPEPIRVAL